MVPVHDFDHKFEQRFKIGHHRLGPLLFSEGGEVPDIQKHHTNGSQFAAQMWLYSQQLVHYHGGNVLAESPADSISLLNHDKRIQDAFLDLHSCQASNYARNEQQEDANEMMRECGKDWL